MAKILFIPTICHIEQKLNFSCNSVKTYALKFLFGARTSRILMLLLALVGAHMSSGQSVALVLSGGGAKGLAHVGVLKVLEENNIPIDYIVGTSMGGVIGGFYAAGYSAEEIEKIALSDDLQRWVRGEPDEPYKIYFDEDQIDPSWFSLKLTLDSGFSASFNANIAKDHVLNLVLAEKMAQATKISGGSFDSLFVPFRTTGSEIFTQQGKVLRSGDLYKSVRASMAVPFFYRPVKINDQYLFDGGLYNNFPAELAEKEFDPDIIIGVNVATKQLTEYPYENDKDLINESILFAILDKTNPTEIDSSDVFIDVQLDRFNAADFKFAKEIVAAGYGSANAMIPEIKRKIERTTPMDRLATDRSLFLKDTTTIKFDSIVIDGFKHHQANYLRRQFDRARPAAFEDLKNGYYRIVSDDYFSSIIPSYHLGERNTFTLSGNPNPKLKGKIGGTLTTRSISQLYVGFDYKRLTRHLSHYSIKLFTGRFYQSASFNAKLKFPGKSGLSIIPGFVYNQWDFINTSDFLLRDSDPTILKRHDYTYRIRTELPLTKKHKLSFQTGYIRYVSRYSNNRLLISSDILDKIKLRGMVFSAQLGGSNLNYRQYAYRGSRFNLSFNYYLLNEDYQAGNTSSIANFTDKSHRWFRMGLSTERYHYISDKYTLGYSIEATYASQPAMGTRRATEIILPGFYPLQDSRTILLENFRGRKFAAVGIKNVLHIASSLQFRLEGYAFNAFEKLTGNEGGLASFERTTNNTKLAGTAGFVFQSLIGPISLSANYYDDDENKWGVLLHFGHILFNQDSLE